MKALRISIFVRVLVMVFAGGGVALALATLVAANVVEDALEAQLVEAAVQRAEAGATRIDFAVEIARAELAAVALAADAGRPLEASRIATSPFVALRCVRGADVLFEAATRDDGEALLRQSAMPPLGRVAVAQAPEQTLALAVRTGDIESRALLDVSRIVRPPRGWTMEMTSDAGELRGGIDGVVLARRERDAQGGEFVRAVAPSRNDVVLAVRAPLAPALAAAAAVTRRIMLWSAVVVIPLFLLALVLARAVTSPVRALAGAVRQSRSGPVKLPRLPRDEIGDLGDAITLMSDRLTEDARALRTAVDFARRVNRMWLDTQVLAASEAALHHAIPSARWKVVSRNEIEDTSEPALFDVPTHELRLLLRTEMGSAEMSAPGRIALTRTDLALRQSSDSMPALRYDEPSSDALYLVLRYGAKIFAVAVGRGVPEASVGHAELLLRVASATLQNLELLRSTVSNEKLAVLGRVVASVTHEVNNPLTFVLANLRSLENELEGPQREAAVEAREGAERVARIIGDLSTLSRGGMQVHPVRLDLAALAAEAARMARTRCPEGTVEVSRGGAAGAPASPLEVNGDPNRLVQVLLNVIINGLEAARSRTAPRVEVRLHRENDVVAVDVRDNGGGVPKSALPHLFEAFFTTKGEDGTGLGLFISRSLAKAHGGDLRLLSSDADGTVFRLELPDADTSAQTAVQQLRAPSPLPRIPSPVPTDARAHRPSILIIDDEVSLVRGLKRWLGSWADVEGTSDALEGLEMAAGAPFDLVLCDLDMPRMTGRELLVALRERNAAASSRLVLMTGSSQEVVTGVTMLHKPIDIEILKRLVAELDAEQGQQPPPVVTPK
jgi:signal transduction histidine kinase